MQWVRSLARSQVMSDPTEKCAGAGDDPNGSLVSRTPISLSSFVGHIAMHLDAIFAVVWKRLYAFSMSILFMRIDLFGLFHLMLCIKWMNRRKA